VIQVIADYKLLNNKKMAKFRQLHTSFWNDPLVLDLTPEQKYFYIYLLTNPKVLQCGIYEISIRQISYETGYDQNAVLSLLAHFESINKIKHSKKTNEIAIINFLKYNYSNSPTVKKCIEKDFESVKNKDLISYVHCIDTLNIEYTSNNKNNNNNNNKNSNKNIEIRIADFYKSVSSYIEFKEIYKEFFEYWSETNPSRTKMKWELEKTWDLKKRLHRWANNNSKFSNNKDKMPNFYDKAYALRIGQDQSQQKKYREHLVSLGYEMKMGYAGEATWVKK
tara:strand:- start:1263 stop:2099 length:837 start_codon:yes stop_codon:yes gene_type:complete